LTPARPIGYTRAMRPAEFQTTIVLALALVGCGGGTVVIPAASQGERCEGYQGQADAADIAQSPRADAEAEVLAIEASGRLVAPQSIYDRIVSDLAAIRLGHPQVAGIKARPSWRPVHLLVGFDAEGKAAVDAETYRAWDCANARYGLVRRRASSTYVLLESPHRFHAALLAQEYGRLPHVDYAEPDAAGGDGDDLCVSTDGDTYHYVIQTGSGDCPSGCTAHTTWGFTTRGAPVEITEEPSFKDGPPPAWFTALADCTSWL
jgi:hypothetical protein